MKKIYVVVSANESDSDSISFVCTTLEAARRSIEDVNGTFYIVVYEESDDGSEEFHPSGEILDYPLDRLMGKSGIKVKGSGGKR